MFVSKPKDINFPIKLEAGSQVEAAYRNKEIIVAIRKWTGRDKALNYHYVDALGEIYTIQICASARKWADNQENLIKKMSDMLSRKIDNTSDVKETQGR